MRLCFPCATFLCGIKALASFAPRQKTIDISKFRRLSHITIIMPRALEGFALRKGSIDISKFRRLSPTTIIMPQRVALSGVVRLHFTSHVPPSGSPHSYRVGSVISAPGLASRGASGASPTRAYSPLYWSRLQLCFRCLRKEVCLLTKDTCGRYHKSNKQSHVHR